MIDHTKQVSFAPEDILAGEMKERHDLYGIFSALLKMDDDDLKLISDIVKRLSK